MIRVTRRYRFCASHRLHSAEFSEERNRELYGKCNHPYGHGHDYVLEVSVAGAVEPQSGQALHVATLDGLVQQCVLREFDHRDLNRDVPEFTAMVPTSENVARVIESRLQAHWGETFAPEGPKLDNVRLRETKRNQFQLR